MMMIMKVSENLHDNVGSTVILMVFCLSDSAPEKSLISFNCVSTALSTRLGKYY